jgi:hypothetical protein
MSEFQATEPHPFAETEELPYSPPLAPQGPGIVFAPPPTGMRKLDVCGVCKQPRASRIHIDFENVADDESPRWGM